MPTLNKAMILHELNMAKIAHERWVKRADHLISGMPVDKEHIPLAHTECGFGKWFYGLVGEKLKSFYVFAPTMEQIEHYHNKLHAIYSEIYDIFFIRPTQRNLLYRIVTLNSKKVTAKEQERAAEIFLELKKTSNDMLRVLSKLEQAVKATDLVLLQRLGGDAKQLAG